MKRLLSCAFTSNYSTFSAAGRTSAALRRFRGWTNKLRQQSFVAALCRGGLMSTERDEDGKMADGGSCRHSCSINVIVADHRHPDLASEHACGCSREAAGKVCRLDRNRSINEFMPRRRPPDRMRSSRRSAVRRCTCVGVCKREGL